ncbi:hypothetical protein AVEN_171281-1 [Araneus ventricosus]|uniref:Uncharacterized protein n=1 Tax=Araneus ventricosus TaxID=182803 RepID=A0A4Y2VED7_ARAVE|nr:hypothetical protein AVEN_265067-1 [Araneus ventricosus]GBO23652.1 hypothetical protein AVEN_62769-1 [Araneus ventricosus]GBO23655.1 hypothetical protein AVEN_120970-1 [Araneus ventricosus]GBO23658.1 hypothetical protein AVEN_171281-1 [Araneus ventricosus]
MIERAAGHESPVKSGFESGILQPQTENLPPGYRCPEHSSKPDSTEDLPCMGPVVWKFGEGVRAQVSSSSSDRG